MRVCEELGDDARLGDDVAVVGEGGDEAALWLLEWTSLHCQGRGSYRVDLKVPWLSGCVQIDDDLFVVKAELLEGDMRSVGPGASVVGVESDFWSGHVAVLCFTDGGIVDYQCVPCLFSFI